MPASSDERNTVRDLARQVAALAREPRMQAIKQRWRDVNALRKPDRAPVWCRPVGCWKEIIPPGTLSCRDEGLRSMEYQFRQVLYKRMLDDDSPVEEYFEVPARFDVAPANVWGVDIRRHDSDVADGSWAYDPPLKEAGDFNGLRLPVFTYNQAKSREALERTAEILDGIMSVKLVVDSQLGATLGTAAADLRGLEQIMMDMIAEPELMRRLMAYLRDAVLGSIDQVEATGLLTPNNTGPMLCSDPIGTPEHGRYSGRNLWCMANSQEFDQVSPAMWEEFCLNYQKPIFSRFGLVAYGCCENLTRKIDGVLSIPNLRIFTCSAWTGLADVIEKVGRRYCIMWRQKASDVVFPSDTSGIRQALLDGARQMQGCYYQVVLRELQTLAGHPDRLQVWTQLAKEAVMKYA